MLEGRDAGYPGERLAARYICSCFESLGLSRVAEKYETPFDLPGAGKSGPPGVRLGDLTIRGSSLLEAPRFSAIATAKGVLVNPDGAFEALFGTPHKPENFVQDLPLVMSGS